MKNDRTITDLLVFIWVMGLITGVVYSVSADWILDHILSGLMRLSPHLAVPLALLLALPTFILMSMLSLLLINIISRRIEMDTNERVGGGGHA